MHVSVEAVSLQCKYCGAGRSIVQIHYVSQQARRPSMRWVPPHVCGLPGQWGSLARWPGRRCRVDRVYPQNTGVKSTHWRGIYSSADRQRHNARRKNLCGELTLAAHFAPVQPWNPQVTSLPQVMAILQPLPKEHTLIQLNCTLNHISWGIYVVVDYVCNVSPQHV